MPPAVMSQGAIRYQGVSSTGVSGVEARSSSTVQAAAPASERGGLGGVMAAALRISVPIVLSLQGAHAAPLPALLERRQSSPTFGYDASGRRALPQEHRNAVPASGST